MAHVTPCTAPDVSLHSRPHLFSPFSLSTAKSSLDLGPAQRGRPSDVCYLTVTSLLHRPTSTTASPPTPLYVTPAAFIRFACIPHNTHLPPHRPHSLRMHPGMSLHCQAPLGGRSAGSLPLPPAAEHRDEHGMIAIACGSISGPVPRPRHSCAPWMGAASHGDSARGAASLTSSSSQTGGCPMVCTAAAATPLAPWAPDPCNAASALHRQQPLGLECPEPACEQLKFKLAPARAARCPHHASSPFMRPGKALRFYH